MPYFFPGRGNISVPGVTVDVGSGQRLCNGRTICSLTQCALFSVIPYSFRETVSCMNESRMALAKFSQRQKSFACPNSFKSLTGILARSTQVIVNNKSILFPGEYPLGRVFERCHAHTAKRRRRAQETKSPEAWATWRTTREHLHLLYVRIENVSRPCSHKLDI